MAKETLMSPVTGEIQLPRAAEEQEIPETRHEVLGVVVLLSALFLLLSLVSYDGLADDSAAISGAGNLMGLAGEWTAYLAFTMMGLVAYLLMAVLFLSGFSLFRAKAFGGLTAHGVLGIIMIVIFSTIGIHTAMRGQNVLDGHAAGGFLGELLGEILISLLSIAGTYLVAFGGILVVILLITDLSLTLLFHKAVSVAVSAGRYVRKSLERVVHAWNEDGPPWDSPSKNAGKNPEEETESKKKKGKKKRQTAGEGEAEVDVEVAEKKAELDPVDVASLTEPKIVTNKKKKTRAAKKEGDEGELHISNSPIKGEFSLPSPNLLAEVRDDGGASTVDEENLKNTADQLVKILSDFAVYGEVREIHPGPVVTMFEFQPKSGTKLSKIENLSSEIAMALEVMRVRVVAPIPGKNAVGFELPNKTRETVFLREMITDDGFLNKKSKLPLSLGKDISGNPFFVDLAKMPHLLIAGTTGSGKSVSLNAMLLSLLYKYTPDDLRFLLVDPKMIELGIYDGIPHLLLPVVTDMSKACLALKWAVDEMERRYQLFADLSVRNLAAYNAKVAKLKESAAAQAGQPGEGEMPSDAAYTVKNDEVVVVSSKAENPEKLDKLPFVVIVVDELADLMMVAAKDVETSIARLAQKARAAGLHLIIATQRPSVDVITGLIKANFPSRISFRVSSGHDSRTILGTNGAENLLGMGDMLIMPPGTSDLTRVHGAFVDDDEIHEIVAFLKAQGKPEYDEEILKPRDDEDGLAVDEAEKDEVYDQAVAIVSEAQMCSISMLQRRLRIGYNRSARIVEIMEKEGVVGPANGVNKREVLISPH